MKEKPAKMQSNYISQKTINVSTTREKNMLKYLLFGSPKVRTCFSIRMVSIERPRQYDDVPEEI